MAAPSRCRVGAKSLTCNRLAGMLRFLTLGRLELTRDGTSLLPGRRKLLAVLAYLVRARGRYITRQRLASVFWPVEDEVRARRSVRQALTDLRRALGPALREREDSVSVVLEAMTDDASELEAAAAAGDLRRVLDLWQGEFLAGSEDTGGEAFREWIEPERHRFRSQLILAAEQLSEEDEKRGNWDAALDTVRKWQTHLPDDQRARERHDRLLSLVARRPSPVDHADIASSSGRGLLSPDFVGREAEFTLLVSAWRNVQAGAPGVILLEGEEGSGKSRLLNEFLRWVDHTPPKSVRLHARAFEAEESRPFALLRYLLAGLAQAPGLGGAPPAVLGSLARVVPEIAERFPSLPAEPAAPAPGDALPRALADAAAESPILLVVDDAQHADGASREALEGLCRHPVPGVLVVLTAVPDHLPGLAGLGRADRSGNILRISLGRLREEDLHALIGGMAEFVPADRRTIATRLAAEAGGNPLIAVEMVMTLADHGVIAPREDGRWELRTSPGEFPLPLSLQHASSARLRQLPADARCILESAAVLGRDCDMVLLRTVSALNPAAFERALHRVIIGRFLRPGADGSSSLEFTHGTVRQVVARELSAGRRQRLHRRAWRALGRVPPGDLRRDNARAHHRAQMGPLIPRAAWLTAAVALLAVVATATTLTRRADPSPTTVAVLPFDVRGSERLQYLGEGMVTLLGAALDGLGELSTADSRSLLTFLAERRADPALGRAAARHVGAGLFVLGDIVEADGNLGLAASLYDARGRLLSTGRITAGSEGGIYRAVEEIATQLVVHRSTDPAQEVARVAATTTSSLPALKAYLQGERELRLGRFSAAVDSFRAAVAIDTAFALAYYRLAIAAEWDQRTDLPEQAARQAARFTGRLTERTAALVEALRLWREGRFQEAGDQYRAILSRYPKDVEAWFQLGEVLFHSGPTVGQPASAANAAWRQVLALEPGNLFAALHLARAAGAEEDSAGLAPLVPAPPDLTGDEDRRVIELAAWRALVFRNPAEERRVLQAMRLPILSGTVIWQLASYSRDLGASERYARHLSSQMPELAHQLTHQLLLARGKWRAAAAGIEAGAGIDGIPLVSRAYLASLPFVAVSREELARLRTALADWSPPHSDDGPSGSAGYHHRIYPLLRLYLMGTLSVRLGDLTAATRHADELERVPDPAHGGSLGRDLVLGVRAMILRSNGDPAAALRFLERMRPVAARSELESPILSRALERFQRAGLLEELGRNDEAIRWYHSMAQLSPNELVFLAPARLGEARVQERLGHPHEAAAGYDRFAELWRDADPESQAMVFEAQRQAARLSAAAKPR